MKNKKTFKLNFTQTCFKGGFTLLEILLVVGIISVLAGIVIVALNPGKMLANTRNTERKSDLKQINNALQQYYIDHQEYPPTLLGSLTGICNTGEVASSSVASVYGASYCSGLVDLSVLVPVYLTAIPADPQFSATSSAGYTVIKYSSSGKIGLSAPAELNQVITVNIPPEVAGACLSNANGFYAGDGTSGNPYQICSWTQLAHVNSHLTESFILNRDLLVTDSDYSGLGNSWTPLGNYSNKFSGEFNGNDKIIHSPVVYLPTTNYVGFFGYSTGSLHNIILHDADITGKEETGSLVGWQQGGVFSANSSVTASTTGTISVGGLLGGFGAVTVSNSYSTGKVSGAGLYAGGLSGIAFTNIENSYSECTVNNTGLHTGGLVGYSWGEISDSYATGAVNSSTDNVGGLVGTLEGTVSNSYATGDTSGGNLVGGLVGYQKAGSISDSYATGDVGDFSSIGGLVGEQLSGVTVSRSYATGNVNSLAISCGGLVGLSRGDISNSYATGVITGEDAVGGLIGWKVTGAVSNSFSVGSVSGSSYIGGMSGLVTGGSVASSFWDKQTSGRLTSGDSDFGETEVGTSTLAMKTQTTFTDAGWDFGTIWNISGGYPFLR